MIFLFLLYLYVYFFSYKLMFLLQLWLIYKPPPLITGRGVYLLAPSFSAPGGAHLLGHCPLNGSALKIPWLPSFSSVCFHEWWLGLFFRRRQWLVRTNGRSTWQAMWGDFKVEQVYLTFPKSWSLPASSSSQVGSGHSSGVLPCPAHLLEPSFGGLRGAHLFGHCPHQGHCPVIRGGVHHLFQHRGVPTY